ncbi:MAG: site-specific integrase [Thaumarchaeota archaeon]|nr:site-specific integrase [Nitrososphaerota archaeon]MDE1867689.1 site-specific integrase [Nitrososphaerota archaeon]
MNFNKGLMENTPHQIVPINLKSPKTKSMRRTNDRCFALSASAIKSEKTKSSYIRCLNAFLDFSHIKEYDDLLKLADKKIQEMVEDYVVKLKTSDLNPNTIPSKLLGVQHFLVMNDKIINWKKIHKMYPEKVQSTGKQAWTTEDLQKMLGVCTNLRAKAILLVFASTSARVGAIPMLKIRDITDWTQTDDSSPNRRGCKKIVIYASSKEEYTSFLTPEASKAVEEYLQKRRIDGEKITGDSPLFRNLYQDNTVDSVKPISYHYLMDLVKTIVKKAGLSRNKANRRFEVQTVHGFRKRYNTILKNNKEINSNIAEKLMGHKNGLDGVYFVPTIEQCFVEFQKAIKDLTVDESERLLVQNRSLETRLSEMENLEDEIQRQKQAIAYLLSKDSEGQNKLQLQANTK